MKKSKSPYCQVENVDLSKFTSSGKNAKVISLVAKNAKEKKYLERLDALEMQKNGLASSIQRPSDWLDKEGIELTDKKGFGKMEFMRPEKLTKRSFSCKIIKRPLYEKKYELRSIQHDLVPVEVITVEDKSMSSEQKAIETSFLKALLLREKNRRSAGKPSTPQN